MTITIVITIHRRGFSDNCLLLFWSGYVALQLRVMLDTPNQYTAIIDLCHAAAILSQEIKKALYFHGLAVQIQSFFNLLGENGCRVTNVYCVVL